MNSKKFDAIVSKAEMGDCIIIRSDGIIADGIEWFTDGNSSHIAMYVGGGKNLITEYTIGGAKCPRITKYCKDKYTLTLRRIKGITLEQAAKMKRAGYESVYKKEKYDYLSYLGYIIFNLLRKIGVSDLLKLNNPFNTPFAEVCSSGYDKWVKAGGIDLFPEIGEELVTPHHLDITDKMETIVKEA